MKKIIRIATVMILALLVSPGKAQVINICAGNSTVLTTPYSAGLSNLSFSMNPGGIISSNPSFVVSPVVTTIYTLYVTGSFNSPVLFTTSSTITVQVLPGALPVTSVSPLNQTVSCGAGAVATATGICITPTSNVTHAWYTPLSSQPTTGSGQSSVFNPPAGMTTTYVVTDNSTGCSATKTINVISTGGSNPTFNLTSSGNFTLGCGTTSITDITIINGQSVPNGGAVSYTLLPPGYAGGLTYSFSPTNVSIVNTPGTYTVIVKDNSSNCETRQLVYVGLNNAVPSISASAPTLTLSCNVPSVALTGSSSTAPVTYTWSYFNGPNLISQLSDTITVSTTTPGASVVNVYTLTVKNQNNFCVNDTVVAIYQNIIAPNAAISGPPAGVCQNTVMLTNVSTSGILPNTFSTSAPVVAALWEGPSPQVTASLSSTYLAQTSGIYTMTAVDMNNGCVKTATFAVTVGPVAAFVHTITGGLAVFNDASTGTNGSTTYLWDFGDGSTSTQQNPVHTYLNGGAHLVKFKVTDPSIFCADSVIQSVNVSGVPCSANSNFSMVPTATAQVWNVVPSYPWNVVAASWNWGDGSGSNTLYTSHQYSAAGMYNICLSVTVSCVASSSSCSTYSVYRASQETMIIAVNVVAPDLISGLAPLEAGGQLSWSMAPNPNAGEFNLSLNNIKSETMRLMICDLTGRMVHEQSIDAGVTSTSVRADKLPSGMYLVTLESGGLKATKRMVVSH